MIENTHLLELESEELRTLLMRATLPMLKHKIQYTVVAADPVTVHIMAIQQQTAMLTPASVIHDKAVELFTPFVKGRHLVVTALPYNKESASTINYSDSSDILNALWLFLTNDTMPDKAMISREAFNHEVGIVIELIQAK